MCRGALRAERLVVAVASTSAACRKAQELHRLGATPAIALGRLITASALIGLLHRHAGGLSVQVVSRGRLHHLFADVTERGHVRAYIKPAGSTMPLLPDDSARRSVGFAVGAGLVSVIRSPNDEPFTQGTAELVSGEIDEDVQHFLESSDQIPTALTCDVVLAKSGSVERAAGIIVQALPGADLERLSQIKAELAGDAFAQRLTADRGDAASLLLGLVGGVEITDREVPLRWKCRCSPRRALAAVGLLGPVDLAEMIEEREPARVECDFCGSIYELPPEELKTVFATLVKAQA